MYYGTVYSMTSSWSWHPASLWRFCVGSSVLVFLHLERTLPKECSKVFARELFWAPNCEVNFKLVWSVLMSVCLVCVETWLVTASIDLKCSKSNLHFDIMTQVIYRWSTNGGNIFNFSQAMLDLELLFSHRLFKLFRYYTSWGQVKLMSRLFNIFCTIFLPN